MESICRHGNESERAGIDAPRVAYTECAEGAAPRTPAVPAESLRIPLNATGFGSVVTAPAPVGQRAAIHASQS